MNRKYSNTPAIEAKTTPKAEIYLKILVPDRVDWVPPEDEESAEDSRDEEVVESPRMSKGEELEESAEYISIDSGSEPGMTDEELVLLGVDGFVLVVGESEDGVDSD